MTDSEAWVRFVQAISTQISGSTATIASMADEMMREYKLRFPTIKKETTMSKERGDLI